MTALDKARAALHAAERADGAEAEAAELEIARCYALVSIAQTLEQFRIFYEQEHMK